MISHIDSVESILEHFNSNVEGLSEEQVVKVREKFGHNKLKEKPKKTMMQRFLEQFKDVMILILLAAAAISFAVAVIEQNPRELFEPALILLIVILNAVMGIMQESKAENALESLKASEKSSTLVIRAGVEKSINPEELVPGDIIKLEAGNMIWADARIIESASLKCTESVLTGESVPSEKDADEEVKIDAPIGDRTNMIFSGCTVAYGTCLAVVTATGMDTEMGKIANLLNEEDEVQTPLQKKLAQLGKYLGILAIAACAIIMAVGIVNGIPAIEIFMTAISLAVSAIPEGLPAIVTIVLSIGVQRMVQKNAIIRKLPAVETLGGASVICSDKTGTLTMNQMTLKKAYIDEGQLLEDISNSNSNEIKKLLVYGSLCCDASLVTNQDDEVIESFGDPTEVAILNGAYTNEIKTYSLESQYKRLGSLPFDSERKLMTSINNIEGQNIAIIKGAFDIMASRCIAGDLEKAKEINDQMSSEALRVIAIGYRVLDEVPEELIPGNIEKDITFMGLVGMIDPPRPEAKDAVDICKKAGIRPVMITGDHIVTASAIAKQLGILRDGDTAITGQQLDLMTDRELDEQVENISVYARVSPENKIRIVKAWQRREKVVSMTGDGVNDAPALKAADIGCAMGITGTDVAKGAADMTLTDDNFATIVDAIREGRGIYANIKKVVGFLLGTNIGEVVTVFIAMLLWHRSPLMSMQLLWINLVTDSLPAIALGMEPVESDIMDNSPKPKNEGLFAHGFGIQIILQGIMFGILALVAYWLGYSGMNQNEQAGQTMAFLVLAVSQVIQAFNMRSSKSLFKTGPFGNKQLNKAAFVSILMIAIIAFTPLMSIFGLIVLSADLYIKALGLIFVPMIIMELCKLFKIIRDY